MKKLSLMKSKKFVIYAKNSLVLMMKIMIVMTIQSIIKSEIIFITLENLEELLKIFVI